MKPLSAPIKVSVDVTDRCTLACAHCRHRFRRPLGPPLSFEQIARLVDELAAMRVFRLGLSGGEPFCRDDLEAIVSYALAQGIPRVFVSTNGTLVVPRRLARLARHRDRVTFKVSIDGPQSVHDEVRGCPGAFAAAVDAIRVLATYRFDVQVTTTLMRATAPTLRETLALAQGLPCTRHYVVEAVPGPDATPNGVLTPEERVEAVRAVRAHAASVAGGAPSLIARIAFADGRHFGFECGAGRNECGVLSDGLVVGCRLLPGIAEGRVQDLSLSALWRSPTGFGYFRHELPGCLGAACRKCASLATCRGGCRAFAAGRSEGREGPDARCPHARAI